LDYGFNTQYYRNFVREWWKAYTAKNQRELDEKMKDPEYAKINKKGRRRPKRKEEL